jgi:hypothetical protein
MQRMANHFSSFQNGAQNLGNAAGGATRQLPDDSLLRRWLPFKSDIEPFVASKLRQTALTVRRIAATKWRLSACP